MNVFVVAMDGADDADRPLHESLRISNIPSG